MTALVPRLFGDVADWFDEEYPFVEPRTSVFRIEDCVINSDYVVRAELPGVDPQKDVSVTVDHGILDIRAERREETRERHRTEFRYGSLHRRVRLPAGADEGKIKARYDKGVLEVTVPVSKAEEPVGRAIPVEFA